AAPATLRAFINSSLENSVAALPSRDSASGAILIPGSRGKDEHLIMRASRPPELTVEAFVANGPNSGLCRRREQILLQSLGSLGVSPLDGVRIDNNRDHDALQDRIRDAEHLFLDWAVGDEADERIHSPDGVGAILRCRQNRLLRLQAEIEKPVRPIGSPRALPEEIDEIGEGGKVVGNERRASFGDPAKS